MDIGLCLMDSVYWLLDTGQAQPGKALREIRLCLKDEMHIARNEWFLEGCRGRVVKLDSNEHLVVNIIIHPNVRTYLKTLIIMKFVMLVIYLIRCMMF